MNSASLCSCFEELRVKNQEILGSKLTNLNVGLAAPRK